MFEFAPSGGVIAKAFFRPVQFHWYTGYWGRLQMLLEVILVGMVFYYIRQEWMEFRHDRKAYVKDVWNICECMNCTIWTVTIGIRVYVLYTLFFTFDMKAAVESGEYVNLESLAFILSSERSLHSLSALLMWSKTFKHLEWSNRLSFLLKMLQSAAMEIVFFAVIFVIVFMGFAQAGYILFSTQIYEFRSFGNCLVNLFRGALNGIDFGYLNLGSSLRFDKITAANRVMGPFFLMYFQVAVYCILVNIFIAILNDAYEANKHLLREKTDAPHLQSSTDQVLRAFNYMKAKMSHTTKDLHQSRFKKWLNKGITEGADLDGDGKISRGELLLEISTGMKKAGVHLAHEDAVQLEREVNELFQEFDEDGSGTLDVSEIKTLKKKLANNRRNKAILKKKVLKKAADDKKEREKRKEEQLKNTATIGDLVTKWNTSHLDPRDHILHTTRAAVREAIDRKREKLQQQLDTLLVRELEQQEEYDVLESRLQQVITTRLASRAMAFGQDAIEGPEIPVKGDSLRMATKLDV